jgi:septum formation protein
MALWFAAEPIVLASKSEARRAMLEAAAIPVEILAANVDERAIESKAGALAPGDVAQLLAREKTRAVAVKMPGRVVIGADQTLVLGSRRFSKPVDCDAAREQLRALRGKTHHLHSAVAVLRDDVVLFEREDTAKLTMRNFSDVFLDAYLKEAGAAVTASVGGYQLEKSGIHLFERVEGDHFTILGLPLIPLLQYLRGAGLLAG